MRARPRGPSTRSKRASTTIMWNSTRSSKGAFLLQLPLAQDTLLPTFQVEYMFCRPF